EIDDMQPAAALRGEALRLRRRIGVEHGRLRHVAAQQAHRIALLEVDGGVEDHGAHAQKLASSFRPAAWLFSTWNCVPTRLSRPIMATTGMPYSVVASTWSCGTPVT